ncbi:hypothetical protein T459_22592 [Capsicum annuum]|uniref:Ubiquitin-like protease family profile domain-containing protein n=1 Tax=Capsicum annuum TaxID=4072 RepID=A0A2G2YPX7_CAPAN|nr:hypothetical protein T459_22592 [Capsicum annuum]
MSCITLEHHVSQYIRGYKLLSNVPWNSVDNIYKLLINVSWNSVDNIIIPMNVSESFHWILVVFQIRHRCLYVYDSMMGGVIHSKNVLDHVRSLSIMIPIFLVATNFYGKRSDIDRHRKAAYIDKSLSELLEYVILKDTPQQEPQSKRKQNDGAISKSEATGNVTRKHGDFKRSREHFGSTRTREY